MRFLLEQGTGIEPAFTAWEAVVLPIYEPCVARIIADTIPHCKGDFVGRIKPSPEGKVAFARYEQMTDEEYGR